MSIENKKITIYLAGPIHGKTDEECRNWRELVKRLWVGETLDPMRRDARGMEADAETIRTVVEQDKLDIMNCDAVLVYFVEPTVGTSMEILFAWEQHVPVFIIDASMKPRSLWLSYHATGITNDIKGALAMISQHLDPHPDFS